MKILKPSQMLPNVYISYYYNCYDIVIRDARNNKAHLCNKLNYKAIFYLEFSEIFDEDE